jgi:acetyl esterase/lipase
MGKAKQQRSAPAPSFPRISYGSDSLNYMTVWLAESSRPSPVVVHFYPGGFRVGAGRRSRTQAKSIEAAPANAVDLPVLRVKQDILRLLSVGISVVAPAHRRPDIFPAPAPFHDAARAVQFVRSMSSEWNIDGSRIAATGASSGACLALWLGCHQDMAKPRSKDPIARESTRLTCVAGNSAVTSVDPRFIRDLLPGSGEHGRFQQLLDFDVEELDRLPASKYRLMEEMSPIYHVDSHTPPTLLRYDHGLDAPLGIHHPSFGTTFKKRMDEVGASCDVVAGGKPIMGSRKATVQAFLRQHLI